MMPFALPSAIPSLYFSRSRISNVIYSTCHSLFSLIFWTSCASFSVKSSSDLLFLINFKIFFASCPMLPLVPAVLKNILKVPSFRDRSGCSRHTFSNVYLHKPHLFRLHFLKYTIFFCARQQWIPVRKPLFFYNHPERKGDTDL